MPSAALPPDRLARAAQLDFGARAGALRHRLRHPRWSADGRWCWYETRTADGTAHVLVNVQARSKSALFDTAALAEALTRASGTALTAHTLALADVQHDPANGTTTFDTLACRWCWHEAERHLRRLGPAFNAGEVASPGRSAAVLLDGSNLCLREAANTTLLTDDGAPDHGWGDFTDFVSQVATRLQATPRVPSVLWSPDSQRFAVMRADLRRVPMAHLLQSAPPGATAPVLHSYRYATPRDAERARLELWFIGRDGTRVRAQLDGLECHAFTHLAAGWCRWSDDGRCLYLVDGSRDARQLTLWRIDAQDGRAERLLDEHGPAVVLPAPSIAEAPIFHVLGDGRIVWWSQRSGWGHLHLIRRDGMSTPITQGEWQVRGLLHVHEDAQRLLFLAGGREPGVDPYINALYAVSFDGSDLRCLTPEAAQHECSVAPNGQTFIDTHSTVQGLPRAVLRDASGTLLMTLETAEADGPPPTVEPFHVTALDGRTTLWGTLYTPPDLDTTQCHPVVEVIYGAPQMAVVPKTWEPNRFGSVAEQLAALGFVVVIIDGPGTPYRSHAFQLASYGHVESCGGLPDHVQAIRQLGADRPWMDLDRVGIVGASGGGYATVRALAESPAFYKVGVSMCGNHDQAAYVAMWGERYQGLFDAERYAAQSNIGVADRIAGALLLIHGDMDDNVHPSHTLRLADALLRAGRRFEMLLVPNAGHMVITVPAVQRRIWDFFAEHLGDAR